MTSGKYVRSDESRMKMRRTHLGKRLRLSENNKEKMSKERIGKTNPNYRHGRYCGRTHNKFNGFGTCILCEADGFMIDHHILGKKNNPVTIQICSSCHDTAGTRNYHYSSIGRRLEAKFL